MKTFKEFREERALSPVILFWEDGDEDARKYATEILEEGSSHNLGKGWTARADKATQPNQKDHVHVHLKGREVVVINTDGTQSHNSDLSTLPKTIRSALRARRLIEEGASRTVRNIPLHVRLALLHLAAELSQARPAP